MTTKELQKKLCMESVTADKVLHEIELYERGVDTTTSISQIKFNHGTDKDSVQIKTEPTFAIDSKGKFKRNQKKGITKKKGKDNNCRNCGFAPWSPSHREECPARGQECNLCKRKGHFAKFCQNAKSAVSSLETSTDSGYSTLSSMPMQGANQGQPSTTS